MNEEDSITPPQVAVMASFDGNGSPVVEDAEIIAETSVERRNEALCEVLAESGAEEARAEPTNVVEATEACVQKDPELALPETGPKPALVFTREQLEVVDGFTFQASEQTKYVELTAKAQASLIELAKGYSSDEIVGAVLTACGIEGQVSVMKNPVSATMSFWVGKQSGAPEQSAPNNSVSGTTDAIIEKRGKVYGDPELSHENIGLNWTGMIQQHYQLRLTHPLPAWLVELMMAGFKIHRSARVFHEDNYTDLEAYGLKFAREHQRAAFEKAEVK